MIPQHHYSKDQLKMDKEGYLVTNGQQKQIFQGFMQGQ